MVFVGRTEFTHKTVFVGRTAFTHKTVFVGRTEFTHKAVFAYVAYHQNNSIYNKDTR